MATTTVTPDRRTPSVFEYSSARDYLAAYYESARRANPRFSLRAWAAKMGFKSHTLLVMILNGKRNMGPRHVPLFLKGLKLSPFERIYFQALVQFQCAKTQEERELMQSMLADLHPVGTFVTREQEEFLAMSHWIHTVLMALTMVPAASLDPEAVHKALGKLGNLVSPREIRSALERLKSLNLIEESGGGKLKVTCEHLTTRDDVANEGVRRYHKNMMEVAARRIDEVEPLLREYQSLSLAVPRDKLETAKNMIRRFRLKFIKEISSDKGDDVYQMSLQFFPFTEVKKS